MTRAFNFCAGPAALPEEVLKELQEETLDYKNKKAQDALYGTLIGKQFEELKTALDAYKGTKKPIYKMVELIRNDKNLQGNLQNASVKNRTVETINGVFEGWKKS